MKALSVRAPWWWFILHAGKDIENRDWPTKVRGTVYIHAGKWWSVDAICMDAAEMVMRVSGLGGKLKAIVDIIGVWENSRGCIVGTVDIVDCVDESDSPWFFGKHGFVLANPVAFAKPIPFKGALGFFEGPDDVHVCEYHPHSSDEEKRCDICQKLMPIF